MICTLETCGGNTRRNWIFETSGMDEFGRWACWFYCNFSGNGKAKIWQIELGAAL